MTERGTDDLETLAEKSNGSTLVLVLPGEMVTARAVVLSARSEKQAVSIAPFAIEDELASDIEDVHVALGAAAATDGSKRYVYAVDETLLQDWLSTFSGVSLRPDIATPDYLLVPGDDDVLLGGRVGGRTLLRHGGWGAAIDDALKTDAVRAIIARAEQDADSSAIDGFQAQESEEARLDALAEQAAKTNGVNLLQGAYAARKQTNIDWRQWRAPSALAASAAMAFIALNVAEGAALNEKAKQLNAETATTLRAAFPEITRVVNPRAQLRAATQTGGVGDPDFLILSSMIASALDGVSDLSLESLRFDAQGGEIRMSVTFGAYDDFETFKEALQAAGGETTEGGSRQVGNRRIGDITIRRA
ncbi:MAG: type II secretion system protein GspL, partial [Pseudomonadota bacterium]